MPGTVPNEWNDLKADANASIAVLETIGGVHSGFNREVEDLWPLMEEVLRGSDQPVWFCGHSLGGAMATICAYRCKRSSLTADPRELHTFGSPRVGNKRYLRHAPIEHFRWVNNNDIVTRVPPPWMGYRHGGDVEAVGLGVGAAGAAPGGAPCGDPAVNDAAAAC